MTEIMNDCPVAIVQWCFKVANFCCPHEYVFNDGSVLAACSLERVARLAPDEGQHQFSKMPLEVGYRDDDDTWRVASMPYGVEVQTGREDWILSAAQCAELDRLEMDEEVQIVIVSVETMALLREFGRDLGKCRTAVRVGHSGRLFSAKHFGG